MVRFLLLLIALALGGFIAYQAGSTAPPESASEETNDATPEVIVTVPSQESTGSPPPSPVRPLSRTSEDPADAPRPVQVEIEPSYSK